MLENFFQELTELRHLSRADRLTVGPEIHEDRKRDCPIFFAAVEQAVGELLESCRFTDAVLSEHGRKERAGRIERPRL